MRSTKLKTAIGRKEEVWYKPENDDLVIIKYNTRTTMRRLGFHLIGLL